MKVVSRFLVVIIAALLLVGLFLAPSHAVLAKGPFAKITVSGGELATDIEITDPALMDFFSLSNFPEAHIEKPQIAGDGYLVTRYFIENDGSYTAWDQLHYYPNGTNQGGYVYYDGLISGSSEYDGKWSLASFSGDSAMRRIIFASEQPLPPMRTFLVHMLYIAIGLAGITAFVLIALFLIYPPVKRALG